MRVPMSAARWLPRRAAAVTGTQEAALIPLVCECVCVRARLRARACACARVLWCGVLRACVFACIRVRVPVGVGNAHALALHAGLDRLRLGQQHLPHRHRHRVACPHPAARLREKMRAGDVLGFVREAGRRPLDSPMQVMSIRAPRSKSGMASGEGSPPSTPTATPGRKKSAPPMTNLLTGAWMGSEGSIEGQRQAA